MEEINLKIIFKIEVYQKTIRGCWKKQELYFVLYINVVFFLFVYIISINDSTYILFYLGTFMK